MIILPYTSRFGRKINLIVSSWAILGVIILIVMVSDLNTRYVGMFLLGVLFIQKIVAYILATEIAPFRHQIIVATALLSFDNITFPLSSIYFKFISNQWITIGYIAIGYTFILAIASFFCPESPRFLVDNGNYKEARVVINKMSAMNNSGLCERSWKFTDDEKLIKDSDKIEGSK